MTSHLQRSFSTLLASLLVLTTLTTLTAPGAQAAPRGPAGPQPAQEAMPEGLRSAFLQASSQPFAASPDGYRARSGGLNFSLRANGLQAKTNGLAWGLALSGLGRGEQMASLSRPQITQTASRLEYRRAVLSEWYRDTALGVEQGFTIHQAPSGAGPLLLQLDLSTDLAGALDADGRGLSFAAPDGQTLRYDHLRAWDASGAQLDASLRYAPGEVMLQVNDKGAAYPLTIDPLIYVEQKVIASGAAGDEFGVRVALSGDTALVGASNDEVGTNYDQGSAYVFTRSGTTWSLQQQLTASDGAAEDNFGWSVALSGDTALVGAYRDDVGANSDQGSAYVFFRSGTTWDQRQKLTDDDDGAAGDGFGYSVAFWGDTALVGAFHDDVGANSDQGSAYVFTRSGMTWIEQGQLTASDGAWEDYFGYSVALWGETAVVGAYSDSVGENTLQGSAYVFTRSGTTWTEQAHLTASDGTGGDHFGWSVALSGDTALLGALFDDVGANTNQGSAYVFTRSGTTWSQQGQLTASDGAAHDCFGSSVALAGETALVGAYDANSGQGSAYVFTRSGTTWTEEAHLTASDGAAWDLFGTSVALSGDTALVGAYWDDVGANWGQGSAYVFTRSGTTWSQQQQLTASDGEAEDSFGYSVALWGETALVGAYGANSGQGSAYVFTRSGTTWSFQQRLTASDGAASDQFGVSVALSGDTALVGAFAANSKQGSAYVFTPSGTTWTEQQKLTDDDGAGYHWFGYAVALSGDTALVGAYGANSGQGSAYVFARSGTTWEQQQKLTDDDGAAGDCFGYSVALSGDTALVGAYGANSGQGSAYVFTRSETTWVLEQKLTASDGAGDDNFGSSVALSGDTALVGAPYDDVGANTGQGSAYLFTRSDKTWSPQQQLTAADAEAEDSFGYSVALSGDTALVGADLDDVGANTNQGSAYVFTRSGTTWSEQAQLTASDGAGSDQFGNSVALSGDTPLVGAYADDVGANTDQGSAYFYTFLYQSYVPLVLKNSL